MAEQHMTSGTRADNSQRGAGPRTKPAPRTRGRMSRGRWALLGAVTVVILALVGVGVWFVATRGFENGPNQFVSASGSLKPGHMTYHYGTFNGLARERTEVTAGQSIALDYTLHATKGSLAAEVVDPDGNIVWNLSVPQNQDRNGTATIPVTTTGKYQVVLIGLSTGGSFDVSWTAH